MPYGWFMVISTARNYGSIIVNAANDHLSLPMSPRKWSRAISDYRQALKLQQREVARPPPGRRGSISTGEKGLLNSVRLKDPKSAALVQDIPVLRIAKVPRSLKFDENLVQKLPRHTRDKVIEKRIAK